MNDSPAGCIQPVVKLAYVYAGLLALLGLGCGAAAHPTPSRGNVALFAVNHATAPFTLRALTVSVDEEQQETTTARGLQRTDGALPVGLMTLAPGPHVLSVRASAEDRTSDRVLSMSAVQTVRIDKTPASITVHVFTPRAGSEHRIELSFDVQGGEASAPLGAVAGPAAPGARCARLQGAKAALCRTELLSQAALASRDVILASCLRDQVLELRTLAAAEPSAGAGARMARFDSERQRISLERARQLEAQASRCATTEMRAGVLAGSW